MLKSKSERRRFYIFFGSGLLLAALIFALRIYRENAAPSAGPATEWGVTFSKTYAEALGLDWKRVYVSALDELGIKDFRIPVYWNDVEMVQKNYNFEDYDWMLNEARARNARVLLAIGRKVPRWPECHIPDWAKNISATEQELKLLGLISAEVKHFSSFEAVTSWQVENEALFKFGLCPPHSPELLQKEVDIVHGLDSRPVVITDSGELSSWIKASEIADVLGISMYRMAWDKYFGYFYYPIPPAYYRNKAAAVAGYVSKVMVTELQGEPWGHQPNNILPLKEQYESMNLERFRSNIDFARRTGLSPVYLWGVEWWYWVKEKHGNAEFWEEAKKLWQ